MDLLLYIFIGLGILAVIGQVLLYSKKHEGKSGIIILNVILALIVAWMSYSSRPSNYNTEQIIAIVLGALSLVALIPYYMKKDIMISKILISISVIGGYIYLWL